MAFQKAVKARAKGRVSLAGPSGSGKTYTALSIAKHMGGSIAVLDSEHGSASKYADVFDFDVMEIEAPYHPDKYIAAIGEAAKGGYDVLIIDSLSHAWFGKGGLLELVDQFAKKNGGGNSYAGWKDATPIQNRMIEAMLAAPLHIIVTMRSKQEYVLEENDKGKKVPRKVGMAPIQRDGMEYEFDVFAELDLDHNLIVSKTRCASLDGRVMNKAGEEFAELFTTWLGGADPVTVPKIEAPEPASKAPTRTLKERQAETQQPKDAAEMRLPQSYIDAGWPDKPLGEQSKKNLEVLAKCDDVALSSCAKSVLSSKYPQGGANV